MWGHRSYLLGPGADKFLFVPSKSLHSQSGIISWLQSPSAVVLEPPKIKSVTISIVSPSICHELMGPDANLSFLKAEF